MTTCRVRINVKIGMHNNRHVSFLGEIIAVTQVIWFSWADYMNWVKIHLHEQGSILFPASSLEYEIFISHHAMELKTANNHWTLTRASLNLEVDFMRTKVQDNVENLYHTIVYDIT